MISFDSEIVSDTEIAEFESPLTMGFSDVFSKKLFSTT